MFDHQAKVSILSLLGLILTFPKIPIYFGVSFYSSSESCLPYEELIDSLVVNQQSLLLMVFMHPLGNMKHMQNIIESVFFFLSRINPHFIYSTKIFQEKSPGQNLFFS